MQIRILVVDAHPLVRWALGQICAGRPDLIKVGEAAGGNEAIALCYSMHPDVITIDDSLPGDDILSRVHLVSTRAITIASRPADVWPWVAQLGQGRGGFYSYDALENLIGCQIHSAEQIVSDWQLIAVGDAATANIVAGNYIGTDGGQAPNPTPTRRRQCSAASSESAQSSRAAASAC